MKIIATFLTFVLVFLPIISNAEISNAEMPEVFKNPEMKNKVEIEQFYKKGSDNKIEGILTKISHVGDDVFVTRIIEQFPLKIEEIKKLDEERKRILETHKGDRRVIQMIEVDKYTVGSDTTISCKNVADIATCDIVKVDNVCTIFKGGTQEETLGYAKCRNKKSNLKPRLIYKYYINPSNIEYNIICKSIVDKTKEIEPLLGKIEKSTSLSLRDILGGLLGFVAVITPIAGGVIGPAVTGTTTAVGIGAATEATSTIAGGVGSKMLEDNQAHQPGTISEIPECVIQTPKK